MLRHSFVLLMMTALLVPAFAAQQRVEEIPPPPPPKEERGFGPFVWRAFSKLSEKERQNLMKLQENDQEAFRIRMHELGEALAQEERVRFEEMKKMAETYRNSTDEVERRTLKATIEQHIRTHYMERLEDNKRQLAEMKRRTARLEEELKKREDNAEKIIEARLDSFLRGEVPPPGRKSRDSKAVPQP